MSRGQREQVFERVRDAILDFRIAPGERLIERELMVRTGASRATIREVIRELTALGLVTTEPRKGAVVALPTLREAQEVYDIRAALEVLAVRRFVEHADDDQRAALRRAFEELERVTRSDGGMVELLAAKDAFYDVLLDGTQNRSLRPILTGLHARIRALRGRFLTSPGRPQRALEEVREILEAIEAGDADTADKAVREHLASAVDAGLLAHEDAPPATAWTRLPPL
jgi:DNA-binding GntR family transcriptional regulator